MYLQVQCAKMLVLHFYTKNGSAKQAKNNRMYVIKRVNNTESQYSVKIAVSRHN